MSIPAQTYFYFRNPPSGQPAIPIVNDTTYNLLTGTSLVLQPGVWQICITGEVVNNTAGAITATNIPINVQSTVGLPFTLNDELIPFGTVLPTPSSYYFSKTYTLPVNPGQQTMQIRLYQPLVSGAGLTIAYKLYCVRLV
jgi:hypothetical protein